MIGLEDRTKNQNQKLPDWTLQYGQQFFANRAHLTSFIDQFEGNEDSRIEWKIVNLYF